MEGGFPVLDQMIISTAAMVLKGLPHLALFLPWQAATHGQDDGGVFLQVSSPRNIVSILSDKAQGPTSFGQQHRFEFHSNPCRPAHEKFLTMPT